jgi:hypothetical protein
MKKTNIFVVNTLVLLVAIIAFAGTAVVVKNSWGISVQIALLFLVFSLSVELGAKFQKFCMTHLGFAVGGHRSLEIRWRISWDSVSGVDWTKPNANTVSVKFLGMYAGGEAGSRRTWISHVFLRLSDYECSESKEVLQWCAYNEEEEELYTFNARSGDEAVKHVIDLHLPVLKEQAKQDLGW